MRPLLGTKSRRIAPPEWVRFAGLLVIALFILMATDWLWRWDQLLYDAQLRYTERPAPDDVVIVAIDEESLASLGRWPWPRSIHAKLVDTLTKEGAKAIMLDVIFAERTRENSAEDAQLVRAVQQSGRVALPVFVEQPRLGGQLKETLPFPELASIAAGLGHVHVELDPDGIARSVYLREGLGEPHWPHIAAELIRLTQGSAPLPLPGSTNSSADKSSPFVWRRDNRILIPYAGPPGQFSRISYAQVLRGEYTSNAFRNKIVFVGATATGLGDALPTPVSGLSQPMPGVEINANVFTALRDGRSIEPVSPWLRAALSLLIVLATAAVLPTLSPRNALFATVAMATTTAVMSWLTLRYMLVWFPPVPALVCVIIAYPLWSWRRLEYALRYLNQELARLQTEPHMIRPKTDQQFTQALTFLATIMPLSGYTVTTHNGVSLLIWGDTPRPAKMPTQASEWQPFGNAIWRTLKIEEQTFMLGIRWRTAAPPGLTQTATLTELAYDIVNLRLPRPADPVELLQTRIEQVQRAGADLHELRRLVADSMEQMGEGMLVVSNVGSVILSNQLAAHHTGHSNEHSMLGMSVLTALAPLLIEKTDWRTALADALFSNTRFSQETVDVNSKKLLVQIVPLLGEQAETRGAIISFVDVTELHAVAQQRSEMIDFLSHDLRSPMVSTLALIELAKRNSGPADLPSLLAQLQARTQRTLSLVEAFVQLTRAQNIGDASLYSTDITEAARNALDQLWAPARSKEIKLESTMPEQGAWVRGDPFLLERAITNLLSNAVKYSPKGTIVTLTISEQSGRATCCVRDNGYGISSENLPHLFTRFQRIQRPEHAQEPGTGLGLMFVKTVANKLDGEVTVQSELGKGSVFCIDLPAEPHRVNSAYASAPTSAD